MNDETSNGLVAIIGGTGLNWESENSPLRNARQKIVETRWGRALVTRAEFAGCETLFLQRHTAPPHDASTRGSEKKEESRTDGEVARTDATRNAEVKSQANATAVERAASTRESATRAAQNQADETPGESEVASTRGDAARVTPQRVPPRLPPHRVNYRANIAALKKLGATAIFASMAVGSLRPEYAPGTLVLLDDFLDFTANRDQTFFDDAPVHIDCTQPHCERLRALLKNAAAQLSLPLIDGGVYACTDGPRFESAAEIRAYRTLGADVVGMTGVPEIALAREANISYCGLAIVTNFAAGVLPQPLTQAEVLDAMREALPRVAQLFSAAAQTYRDDASTRSRRVTEEYGFPSVF